MSSAHLLNMWRTPLIVFKVIYMILSFTYFSYISDSSSLSRIRKLTPEPTGLLLGSPLCTYIIFTFCLLFFVVSLKAQMTMLSFSSEIISRPFIIHDWTQRHVEFCEHFLSPLNRSLNLRSRHLTIFTSHWDWLSRFLVWDIQTSGLTKRWRANINCHGRHHCSLSSSI